MVPWWEAVRRTWLTTIVAALWGAATYHFSPLFFWWLTPVLAGMVLAAPIVRFSSSLGLGQGLGALHLLMVPSETQTPQELSMLDDLLPQTTTKIPMLQPFPEGQVQWQTLAVRATPVHPSPRRTL